MSSDTGKPDSSDARSAVQRQAAQMPPAAKADISDVHSHVSSTVDEATIYEVAVGDSLSKIAKYFYDDGNAWKTIFEANRDQLRDPHQLKPGQMLKIPTRP